MVLLLCRNSITHVAKKFFCMRFFMRRKFITVKIDDLLLDKVMMY